MMIKSTYSDGWNSESVKQLLRKMIHFDVLQSDSVSRMI